MNERSRGIVITIAIIAILVLLVGITTSASLMHAVRSRQPQVVAASHVVSNNNSGGLELLGGGDGSASMQMQSRENYLAILNEILDEGVPPRTPFQLWTFASDVVAPKVMNGTGGVTDLGAMETWLIHHPSQPRGTYIKPLLTTFLAMSRQAARNHQGVILLILSDGGWNDLTDIIPIAQELAALTNVKALWVVPVTPEGSTRSQIEKAFAGFGGRLIVSNQFDLEDGLDRLRDLAHG